MYNHSGFTYTRQTGQGLRCREATERTEARLREQQHIVGGERGVALEGLVRKSERSRPVHALDESHKRAFRYVGQRQRTRTQQQRHPLRAAPALEFEQERALAKGRKIQSPRTFTM